MPRPTARVLALLELLQAGGVRSARELADRLAVDERTVRRYVEHLLELDVPVEAVRGRFGGYRIGAGYRMPPLMLTDEEAVAVVLGLAGSARSGPSAAVRTAAETAAAKVHRVLPAAVADQVAGLLDVRTSAPEPRSAATPADRITTASAAAADRRPLLVRHRRGAAVSERHVQPWGVVEHGGRWYLVGPDSASGEVRTFRLDRVEHLEPIDGRFAVPDGFDPVREVLASIASAPRDFAVCVLVRASEERIRRRLPPSIARLRPVPAEETGEEGWVRVRLEARRLDWVAGVLAALDAPFRIEQSEPLRAEVRALAERLLERTEGRA